MLGASSTHGIFKNKTIISNFGRYFKVSQTNCLWADLDRFWAIMGKFCYIGSGLTSKAPQWPKIGLLYFGHVAMNQKCMWIFLETF
jgi:hypothetical protein